MNKYIVSVVASLLVGLGLGYAIFHNGASTPGPVGGITFEEERFLSGLYAGSSDQFSISSAGAVVTSNTLTAATGTVTGLLTTERFKTETLGSSSSSPAALGAAASGFFTATTTAQNASTTAVTSTNSIVLLQQVISVPTAGTTCTTARASTTAVSIVASSTDPSINGFILNFHPAPPGTATPYCFNYQVLSNN